MKISKAVILGATYWEFSALIKQNKLRSSDQRNYVDAEGKLVLRLCGIGSRLAGQAAQELIALGAQEILLCGFAGALQKNLPAGTLILDIERSSPNLAQKAIQLAAQNKQELRSGKIYCSKKVLISAAEKADIAAQTGALAVEMESDPVFEICAQKQCALLALRAISDQAEQSLPPLALRVDPFGKISIGWILKFIFSPIQWTSFFALAQSSKKAERALTHFLKEWIQN